DQKEALSLADRIAVMRQGLIEQIGAPRSIYRSPVNRFVADFVGETNWLEAEVEKVSPGQVWLQTIAGLLRAATDVPWQTGQKVSLGFRPESVQIGPGDINSFHTRIAQVCYLGE